MITTAVSFLSNFILAPCELVASGLSLLGCYSHREPPSRLSDSLDAQVLRLEKGEQVPVDDAGVCRHHAVREAGIDLAGGILEQLSLQ